jgi:hypothetical protein
VFLINKTQKLTVINSLEKLCVTDGIVNLIFIFR